MSRLAMGSTGNTCSMANWHYSDSVALFTLKPAFLPALRQ